MSVSKKIKVDTQVTIKVGDMANTNGFVTMIAIINGVKRYYVKRLDNSIKWYTYFQLKKLNNGIG